MPSGGEEKEESLMQNPEIIDLSPGIVKTLLIDFEKIVYIFFCAHF